MKDFILYVLNHYTGTQFVTVCERIVLQKIDPGQSVSTVISAVTTALEYYNLSIEYYNINHPHTDFEPKDNKTIKNLLINEYLPQTWINILQSESALGGCQSVQELMTILHRFAVRLNANQYQILRQGSDVTETDGQVSDSALHQRVRSQGEDIRRLKAHNSRITNQLNQIKGSRSRQLQGQQFGQRQSRSGWNNNYGARGGARVRNNDQDYRQSDTRSYNTRGRRQRNYQRNNRRDSQRDQPQGILRNSQSGRPKSGGSRNRNEFKGDCFNCTKYGHSAGNCPSKINEETVAKNRAKFMEQKKASRVAFRQPPSKRRKLNGRA